MDILVIMLNKTFHRLLSLKYQICGHTYTYEQEEKVFLNINNRQFRAVKELIGLSKFRLLMENIRNIFSVDCLRLALLFQCCP